MSNPYIYLAISKKVPEHHIDNLIHILTKDYGVSKDQIKMHIRGASYNASKANNATIMIGVTHNEVDVWDDRDYSFPKGSFRECERAYHQGKPTLVYDYRSGSFHSIMNTYLLNEADWSDEYGNLNCSDYESNMRAILFNNGFITQIKTIKETDKSLLLL